MEIFNKSISSIFYNILGAIFGLFTQFLAAKILGLTEFGKWNYFIGLANSMIFLFSFGVSFYFPIIFQKSKDVKKIFSEVFNSFLVIFLGSFPLLFFVLKPKHIEGLDVFLLFLCVFFLVIVGYYRAFLIGLNKADLSSKINTFYLRLLVLASFLFFYFFIGKSNYTLIYATLFGNIVIAIIYIKNNLKLTKPNFSFLKGSAAFYIIQLLYGFFNEYSKVIQANLFNYESVSLLAIALLFAQIIILVSQNIANVSMPAIAKAFMSNNIEKVGAIFKDLSRLTALFIIPIYAFLYFNSSFILSLLGKDYVKGTLMVKLTLTSALIGSLVGPNGSVLLMTNKSNYEIVNSILKIVVFLLILFSFGKNIFWGLALCISASEIFVNVLKSIEVYHLHKLLPYNKKEGFYVLFVLFLSVLTFYVTSVFVTGILNKIIVNGFLLSMGLFFSFHFSPIKTDRVLIRKILKIRT